MPGNRRSNGEGRSDRGPRVDIRDLVDYLTRALVDHYIGQLQAGVDQRPLDRDLSIMQSNGGLVSPALARAGAIRRREISMGLYMCVIQILFKGARSITRGLSRRVKYLSIRREN